VVTGVGEAFFKAGAWASLESAVGGEFLAAADGVERFAVAVGGGTSSVAVDGIMFLVAGGCEPLVVVGGDEMPGLARLLVAVAGEPWSVPHGGGARERGGPSEL
jgi:hypothetical protein